MIRIVCGHYNSRDKPFATFMPVPKASVYKYSCFILWKYYIQLAGEWGDIFSISESLAKKILAHDFLRFGVLTWNVRHIFTSCFFWSVIHSTCPYSIPFSLSFAIRSFSSLLVLRQKRWRSGVQELFYLPREWNRFGAWIVLKNDDQKPMIQQ